MNKLKVLDLFSGIGGFSLGLERTGGFETVAFCEIEPFPQKVLKKHWLDVPVFEDVRVLNEEKLQSAGISRVDVITGGFPCQDLSAAGSQAGMGEGTRSGLWSEIVRLTRDLRPRYIIVENVANLLSGPSERRGGWFGRVLGDLAECGYDAEWENIPASAVGAPHRRERVWIVAYPNEIRLEGEGEHSKASQSLVRPQFFPSEAATNEVRRGVWGSGPPRTTRMDYGFPNWVDRVGACGNAVVPQIPEMIGRAILEAEHG